MAIQTAVRDPNRVVSLIGVDSSAFAEATTVAVDPTTHELLVKASLSQDIQIGAVEIKNSTDDTRATVGANGLYVDIRNIQTGTNSIGQVTANAGTNLNTSALATSAKQDTLLTELQLKADLTETQPVSLASVPSHAVTNAGTFVVQENGSALTALQLIDNMISGSEAQVDVITMPTVDIEPDGTALSNNQITVDTTAGGTTIIAASAGRQGITITNQGSVACYVGTGTVTSTNGFLLSAGESIALPTDSEVKAITASGSTTIGYLAYA